MAYDAGVKHGLWFIGRLRNAASGSGAKVSDYRLPELLKPVYEKNQPMMFKSSTSTQRRLRVKVAGVTMPSPVVVAMEKFG